MDIALFTINEISFRWKRFSPNSPMFSE